MANHLAQRFSCDIRLGSCLSSQVINVCPIVFSLVGLPGILTCQRTVCYIIFQLFCIAAHLQMVASDLCLVSLKLLKASIISLVVFHAIHALLSRASLQVHDLLLGQLSSASLVIFALFFPF
jgi:hypothetical protein